MWHTCVSENEKCEPILLCIIQWPAILGLTWDFNAEMTETSISPKYTLIHMNALYKTYHSNIDYII